MKYRAYKYRLYPNEEQKVLIAKHLGSCRFIYNYALDKKVRAYQTDKTNLSRFDIFSSGLAEYEEVRRVLLVERG